MTELPNGTVSHHKPIIGLAGGVGSGKTTVAKMLAEMGAGVIESDALAHQEINCRDVKETLCRWWGQGVFAADGSVDREKVAAIVFADAAQRHRLETLLHPRIGIRRERIIAQMEAQPNVQAIVLDSPLLYETDLDLLCDAVVFVETGLESRRQRSEKSKGWGEGEMQRREKTQQPLDMKRARADYICDNNSSLAALRRQVERIFTQIVSGAVPSRDAHHER